MPPVGQSARRVRAVEGFEHGFAANDFGREEFECVDAVFQSQLDFARSGNAGNQGDAAVVAGFGEGFVQPGLMAKTAPASSEQL